MEYLDFILANPIYTLLVAFGLSLLIQLYYYFFYYSRILFLRKKRDQKQIKEPVSIVICARNEKENLEKYLPSILTQDYPNYEVIVVNDCSEDESEFVLERLQKKYKNLKVTTIKQDEKFYHTKKLALTIGIKAAKNDLLLLTDADCTAYSNKWIEKMQANFTDKTDIVLGYGGYIRERKLVNNIIRFDTLFIALQYLTFALGKKTYMGVGRNLAYRKSIFFKNKGFASHNHIESGDDDLFIHEVANKKNTKIEISQESITRSKAESTFSAWFKQKKRHITTGKLYKFGTKWRLFCENTSRISFYILFVLSLMWFKDLYIYILGAFAFRMIIQLIVYKVTMIRFHERNLLISSILYDFLMPYLNFSFILANSFTSKRNKWK
ncbi:MAG: glycosyltransferase [Bacteroidales bacterium]|jgi:biofilm PGA synthesis N-glycosyltransferase PgaC|nr:glycosyltransferase [Bacteroidales bacterium]